MNNSINRQTELRQLPAGYLSSIASVLDINKDYEKVLRRIPKNPGQSSVPKYSREQIDTMKKHASKLHLKFAEVLFAEWGTSGEVRPTVGTLLHILQDAQILRAADDLAEMIGEPRVPRPRSGPGALISLDIPSSSTVEIPDNHVNDDHNAGPNSTAAAVSAVLAE